MIIHGCVNILLSYSPKYRESRKSFGLYCEDAQDKYGSRLRIKGATA